MSKIAFAASCYTDCNFTSGGVKLNFLFLEQLKQTENYSIDLYCDDIIHNNKKIFDMVYPLSELDKNQDEYDVIISEKGIVPSDITYIHDHSYLYRTQMMSGKISHTLYKIFNRKKHLKRLNEYLKTKENLANCKIVIVSSEVLKNDIIQNYEINAENIVILPPPTEKYSINSCKNKIFTFGISAIGFNRKGGYLALQAIKELKKTHTNFKVKFIYPSKNLFVRLAKNLYGIDKYCEILPAQTDMGSFYNSIDCLLMPSIIEPFGMVATEALSTGCPVITAKHCGASDFIINGENGYIYETSGNISKNLADAMAKMIDTDLNKYYKMCKYAIKSVENTSCEDFVSKYFEIMETLH